MSASSNDPITTSRLPRIISPGEPGRQPELFPLRSTVELPECVEGADVWGRVIADDGKSYIVKGGRGTPTVPASEWIGTHVAEELRISCASPRVIQLQSGELLFGSLEVSGVANKVETTHLLTSITQPPGAAQIPGLRAALSEVYTLDMFLNNFDRHDENFITSRSGATATLFVIDFARSLFWHESFDLFPRPNQHTVVTGRQLRKRHGFDLDAANRMIDRIVSVPADRIKEFLLQMPREWLPDDKHLAFLQWWGGQGRRRKLDALRKGLEDDSLL
jgi:hypothetical protein